MTAPNAAPRTPASPIPLRLTADSPADGPSCDELIAMAHEQERAGHRIEARAAFERALASMRTPADAKRASDILRWIARGHQFEGDTAAALDCLDAAVAVAQAHSDDAALGHALNVQAVVVWQCGDMDEAERLSLLARSRAIHAGDAKLAAMTAQNLGVLANIRGDFAAAEQQYLASLSDYRQLDLTNDICVALNNLGLLYIARSRWADAERVLVEGTQICERSGNAFVQTQLDINLAELWVKQGELARAHTAVRNALQSASQTGDASAVAKGTKLLGVIARESGNFDEAENHFLRADEVATARGELLLQAEIARDRADLARRMGRNRDVLQQLNRAHRLFGKLRAQHDVADIGERVGSLEAEFLHVARRWGESIEAKDRYTQGHCQRVAELACAIAVRSGFDETALFWFRIGALLHDVGKLVIPADVLNKPGKLDDREWELMRSHTTAGVEMLADIEFPWDVRPMVESHHERWDGRGYPHGLAGDDIPVIARILSIADVYDALTSVRSYKRALSHDETMTILRKDVGTVFDPTVFAWFEDIAADWPARLASLLVPSIAADSDVPEAHGEAAVQADDDEERTRRDSTDAVTGFLTRRAFHEHAEAMLGDRVSTGRPVSILIIGIDQLRQQAAPLPAPAGDAIVRLVAEHIRLNTRPGDLLARNTGDECVVMLPGTRLEDASAVAERIRDAIAAAPYPRPDEVWASAAAEGVLPDSVKLPIGAITAGKRLSVSVGVACAPLHGATLDALFGAADSALYRQRSIGGDVVASAPRVSALLVAVSEGCFVGREAERERLREHLASAAAGDPRVVLLSGEGGIGKSTLLKQLAPDVCAHDGALIVARCIEANGATPYAPWIDIVRAIHRAELVDRGVWWQLARLIPELDSPQTERPSAVHDDPGAQRRLLEECEAYLRAAAERRPLVVIVDDMQWADPASWDVLEFLLARLRDQRILVCVSLRSEDVTPAVTDRLRRLSRFDRCAQLRLDRLDRAQLALWLRSALSGQTPSPALQAFVADQSEGNPFFAVQTVRALVDDGQLTHEDNGWNFCARTQAVISPAIGDLVARRTAHLPKAHRDVLAMAAIIGREFDPEVLVGACSCDEAMVHDALDHALSAGVLQSAVLPTSIRAHSLLSFSHRLLARELLRDVNPLRLRRMHARVAHAMEAMPNRDAAELLTHYDRAGLSSEAYRTACDAAVSAHAVFAFDNAAALYDIAIRHARDVKERAQALWALAQTQEHGRAYSSAEENCTGLLALIAEHEELSLLSLPARRMCERLCLQRGVSTSLVAAACEALLRDAHAQGNTDEEAAVLVMLSMAQQRMGNLEASAALARRAVELAEQSTQMVLMADAMTRLGSVLLASDPASAVPHYRRALDLCIKLGDLDGQMRCHINVGSSLDHAGDHAAAQASYLTALAIGRDIRASDYTGVASLNLGVLLLKTGRFDEAGVRFADAHALFVTIGHEPHRLAALYNIAQLALSTGDMQSARTHYGACIALAEQVLQTDVHIGALAGAGLAELELGRRVAASELLQCAERLLAAREEWWFQGREMLEALRLRLQDGDETACRARLLGALARAEGHDQYAAPWLGAHFGDLLAGGDQADVAVLHRLRTQAHALGYAVLVLQMERETRAVETRAVETRATVCKF